MREAVVFLLDVDTTLLENDRVVEDLRAHLQTTVGGAAAHQDFVVSEDLRREFGYADYLGALQRFRLISPHATELLRLSLRLGDYPLPLRAAVPGCARGARTSPAEAADGDLLGWWMSSSNCVRSTARTSGRRWRAAS